MSRVKLYLLLRSRTCTISSVTTTMDVLRCNSSSASVMLLGRWDGRSCGDVTSKPVGRDTLLLFQKIL
jgi:hypothetical protein